MRPVVADRLLAAADSAAAIFTLHRAMLLFRPDALHGRGAGEFVALVYHGRLERKMATSWFASGAAQVARRSRPL